MNFLTDLSKWMPDRNGNCMVSNESGATTKSGKKRNSASNAAGARIELWNSRASKATISLDLQGGCKCKNQCCSRLLTFQDVIDCRSDNAGRTNAQRALFLQNKLTSWLEQVRKPCTISIHQLVISNVTRFLFHSRKMARSSSDIARPRAMNAAWQRSLLNKAS